MTTNRTARVRVLLATFVVLWVMLVGWVLRNSARLLPEALPPADGVSDGVSDGTSGIRSAPSSPANASGRASASVPRADGDAPSDSAADAGGAPGVDRVTATETEAETETATATESETATETETAPTADTGVVEPIAARATEDTGSAALPDASAAAPPLGPLAVDPARATSALPPLLEPDGAAVSVPLADPPTREPSAEARYEALRREELGALDALSERLRFGAGESVADERLRPTLDRVFEILFLYAESVVEVRVASNEADTVLADRRLSRARAEAIVDYLVARGLERGRFTVGVDQGGGLPSGSHRVTVRAEDP